MHCWRECKLVWPLWKTVWRFLKKLKIEIPYDPVVSLLGYYPKKTKILTCKDTYTSMFIVALFIIARIEKQPTCPLIHEWIMMYMCACALEYYSAIKRMQSGHLQQHGWTQDIQRKVKCVRERQIPYAFTYVWNLKNQMNTQKSRIRPINTENRLMVAKEGKSGREGEREWEIQAFSYGMNKSQG